MEDLLGSGLQSFLYELVSGCLDVLVDGLCGMRLYESLMQIWYLRSKSGDKGHFIVEVVELELWFVSSCWAFDNRNYI